MADQKVVAPKEVTEDATKEVKQSNQEVEKAGAEAAKRLDKSDNRNGQGAVKERFNVTDAVLGEDEQHGETVKEAQARTNGTEYKKEEPVEVTPAPSQNQNNLKHPEDKVANDPHASRNYLGQLI